MFWKKGGQRLVLPQFFFFFFFFLKCFSSVNIFCLFVCFRP